MLESLTIDGVRGIDHLQLDGLSLVNVIAGDNGVGKTTILESVVLLFGANPVELRRAQNSRGIPVPSLPRLGRPTLRGLNESLFSDFSDRGEAVISGQWIKDYWETHLISKEPAPSDDSAAPFDFDDAEEEPILIAQTTVNGGAPSGEQVEIPQRIRLITTTDRRPASEDSRTWGNMRLSSERRTKDEVITSLRAIRDEVADVEYIQSDVGEGFYARLGVEGYVPLGALGGGANALFRYLLALQRVAGGILAIDEVEGGFYYRRVDAVFRALLVAARLSGTQIFCTTHSQEVLAALVKAANDLPGDDLSVISVYRSPGGHIAAQVLHERDALNSLELGYELR